MIPQRQTGARSRAREAHGGMPNPRQVASEEKRSPSSKSALSTKVSGRFLRIVNSEMANPECGIRVKGWVLGGFMGKRMGRQMRAEMGGERSRGHVNNIKLSTSDQHQINMTCR